MSSSDRMIPMTSAQRSERAFLPLQRDHRLFGLTDNYPTLHNFYSLMSVSTPCSDKNHCCRVSNQYLGRRARKYITPECVNMECVWNVRSYAGMDICTSAQ